MFDQNTWNQVGQLHAENLDRGFLATLGPKFLALLYRAIDETRHAVLFVERNEQGDVIGFVAGAAQLRPIYRRMFRFWPRLLVALLPIISSPTHMWRVCEIFLYGLRGQSLQNMPDFELLSIAIAPRARGTGVAENLYENLVSYCRANNVAKFKITVGKDLMAAHRFYTRMGAEVVGEVEVHRGEKSAVYVHDINSRP